MNSTGTCQVRLADNNEAADIAALAAATFPAACPENTPAEVVERHIAEHLSVGKVREWLASDCHRVLVAIGGGGRGLLGYAVTILATPALDVAGALSEACPSGIFGEAVCEISKVYVRADVQGSGVADALMLKALDSCQALATSWRNQQQISCAVILPQGISGIEAGPENVETELAQRGVDFTAQENAVVDISPIIWLGTNQENVRAQRFYRRHGFQVIGTRDFIVGGMQHSDYVMLYRPTELEPAPDELEPAPDELEPAPEMNQYDD